MCASSYCLVVSTQEAQSVVGSDIVQVIEEVTSHQQRIEGTSSHELRTIKDGLGVFTWRLLRVDAVAKCTLANHILPNVSMNE